MPSPGETQITQSQATGYAYGPAYEYTIADFQAEDSLLCHIRVREFIFRASQEHRRKEPVAWNGESFWPYSDIRSRLEQGLQDSKYPELAQKSLEPFYDPER